MTSPKRLDLWVVTDDFWQRVEPFIPARQRVASQTVRIQGRCSAPQMLPRPPCTTRICEPVAAASSATYPRGTAAGTRLGAGTLWSQAVTDCCRYSKASRPWRRQVSITEKPRAMKRSPRRERGAYSRGHSERYAYKVGLAGLALWCKTTIMQTTESVAQLAPGVEAPKPPTLAQCHEVIDTLVQLVSE